MTSQRFYCAEFAASDGEAPCRGADTLNLSSSMSSRWYGLKLHWDCISNYLHSLAYCISHIGSVTVETNSSEASQELACQKIVYMIDCPEETLYECDSVAIDFINDAFKVGFKSLRNFYCSSVSLWDASDLPLNEFHSSS
ncbi:hypothetical protein TNCV_4845931 [Trichonephila clavipes]|uniref:Uncharacterized protein n=1 Tax=Trichonephila clavipes TaxID=2585209 RepID=A0A8X6WM28_TRICX|nr:hypothetical protein TNCV_4845931 [Trichonephila clavipes]